jgi:hypothetical protein
MLHPVSSHPHRASPGHGRQDHPRPSGSAHSAGRRTAFKSDYTIAHAGRQFRFGPIAFWTAVVIVCVMALWSAGTATYFAFRDDLLTRLIARQAEMQYAYEDRIAELRSQVDRLTSRQMLDQEQVEQKIDQLTRRQSTLESRAATLSGMPDMMPTGTVRPAVRPGPRSDNALPGSTKPSPINDTMLMGPAQANKSVLESRVAASPGPVRTGKTQGVIATLLRLEESLDLVEQRQGAALLAMSDGYEAKARHIRGVLVDLGLDVKKLAGDVGSGVGGPFVPLPMRGDATAFDRQMQRVQVARAHFDRLTRTLVAVPVRRPLGMDAETSSGFGVRLDPFIRAPAMHSGLDFRAPTGEPARATAAGKVVTAGWSGGYGKMVEIDHGNGFSTRYGHLSEILVKEDQAVRPGQIVGRVGSTGRSTGPHLHYETRVDGDAVDPHKFLRAGLRLGEKL